MPVLTLQGAADIFSVRDGAVFDAALASHPDHTLKTYAGLGHSLGPSASRSDDIFRPIAPEPLADLTSWLQSHAALPVPGPASRQIFPETGYSLAGDFLRVWHTNGGLPLFGYPVEATQQHAGHVRQRLERARLELHPDNSVPYRVLLGRLGVETLAQQGRPWEGLAKAEAGTAHFFSQTGHAVAHEPFWEFWSGHGLELDGQQGASEHESIALFGYPISEPQMETNADGARVLTQWFERARFEYYPDNPPAHRVLLGRLGADLLTAP
jgi:hypothetical protein